MAGVSVSTVSLVMNGKTSVAPTTAKRVLEAAEKLDYRPHQAARSLASKRADAIGLLLPHATPVSDAFFAAFLSGVLEVIHQAERYVVLLPSSVEDETTVRTLLQAAAARRIDAVVLMEASAHDSRVRRLVERSVPTVLFGRSELPVPWVDIDNRVGGELAARHLLEFGHRRLAHIAAPTRFTYASERCDGFVQAVVAELGASARPRVADADLTAESAYRAADALLDATVPPTAIFAASDLMASGVLACAQRRGLSVPEQLSIVGYDDTHLARSGFPTLTTVSQEPRRIGRRVGELLLQHLADGSVQTELVVPTLRTGESTAGPPPGDL